MRWFKHITAAHEDEKIAAYMAESKRPLEAYGFWWMLLEVVAAQMEKGNEKCSATYSLTQWSHKLYSHHNLVSNQLSNLSSHGLVTVEYSLGKVIVTIPNLLKYRDEYSKKSGQKTEQERETDTDTDTDIKDIDIPGKKQPENPPPTKIENPDKQPPCPVEKIAALWNSKMPELRSVEKIHETRRRHVTARWRENPEMQNLASWEKFFDLIRESNFLMGRAMPTEKHPSPFRCTFDWVINASNFVKIYELNYA